jgi:hypothetical protein
MPGRRGGTSRSLFNGSFAPYAATAGVGVGYALWLTVTTLVCVVVLAGFGRSAASDVVSLALVAPLLCLVSLGSGRVFIEAVLAILGLRPAATPVPAEARVRARTLPPRERSSGVWPAVGTGQD